MAEQTQALAFDVTQVEDSVGYLLSRSRTMLSRSIDQALSQLDITHAQGSIFMMLFMSKCSTAAELSRELFIDSAALKRTLDKMVDKGFVRRVSNPADRRLFTLELSDEGRAVAVQLPAIYRGVIDLALTGFTQEELGFLKCLLRKLLANRSLLEASDFSQIL